MMNFLFGIPYYKSKIDPSQYDKKKIISDIEENYNRLPLRNNWNMIDDIHQSYDDDNEKFIKINYDKLYPLYDHHISTFMNEIPSVKKWNYKWRISNYTATANHQEMSFHNHHPSLFHAIHYLKFDSTIHKPTVYKNSCDFGKYFVSLYDNADKIFDYKDSYNSWMCESYSLNTEEDDFIILPSVIHHGILKSFSDSLRMTIVMNIDLDN